MARKRPVQESPPPSASSSEEEQQNDTVLSTQKKGAVGDRDDEESGPEEDNESDDDKKKRNSGECESGSDSDSESSQPSASAFTVKPISPPPKPAPKKVRKRGEGNGRGDEESEKAADGIRVLSGEDGEIALLNAVIKFQSETRSDPRSDPSAFHDFIRGSLHANVSKSRLMEKIRRLRRKFLAALEKSGGEEEASFSKPSHVKAFELSRKIWGSDKAPPANNGGGGGGSQSKVNGAGLVLALPSQSWSRSLSQKQSLKPRSAKKQRLEKSEKKESLVNEKAKEDKEEKEEKKEESEGDVVVVGEEYVFLRSAVEGLPERARNFVWLNLELIGEEKMKELDSRWRSLRMEEVEILIKKSVLQQEMMQLVMDAVNSTR